MKKTIQITLPESWADVTLKGYLELQKELENYSDDEEAVAAVLLWKLCGIDGDTLKSIPRKTVMELRSGLSKFLNSMECPLQRIIEIDGVRYGFEPNLSRMSYGAYADITQSDKIGIDENWSKTMSILYRPITNQKGELYNIEPYTGEGNSINWESIGMDVHLGVLFFFLHLSLDLVSATQNSLMGTEAVAVNWDLTSLKSGKLMEQLLNLQMGTLRRLIQSHENL